MGSESASEQVWCEASARYPFCGFVSTKPFEWSSLTAHLSRIERLRPRPFHKPMQFPGLILVQSELGPQINPTHFFIGGKARRRAALENYASVDDVGAIGDAQRFTNVVIGDEDADAAVPQVENDFLNIRHRDRIDAGKRLV